MLTVYATRTLNLNDEITISYLHHHTGEEEKLPQAAVRQTALGRKWNFVCIYIACRQPAPMDPVTLDLNVAYDYYYQGRWGAKSTLHWITRTRATDGYYLASWVELSNQHFLNIENAVLKLDQIGHMYPVAKTLETEKSVWYQIQLQLPMAPWVNPNNFRENCREAAKKHEREALVRTVAATGPDSAETLASIDRILAI